MPKASELKKGMIIDIGGVPYAVKHLESKSPSSRGSATIYKIRFNNLQTQEKLDSSFKGDDLLKEANCLRVLVQYLYLDGDTYYFMNQEDYSQHGLNAEKMEEQIPYLAEQQQDIVALIMDDDLIAIELPQSVNLVIKHTPPSITGSSATNRSKTAVLSTGLEIQVPEYLESGESIKINTATAKFISRA